MSFIFYKKPYLLLVTCLLLLFAFMGLGYSNVKAATTNQVPVFRLYDSYSGQHLQTISSYQDQVLSSNAILDGNLVIWTNESPTFYAFNLINGLCPAGTVPVYQLYNDKSGEHLLTADLNEVNVLTSNSSQDNWFSEGVNFCDYRNQVTGTVPVYRLYNDKSGEHLLTADLNEVNALNGKNNWSIEYADNNGVAFYASYY